ncbi:MAG: hypothetical protein R3A48_15525 [Polyangiales bacterium]
MSTPRRWAPPIARVDARHRAGVRLGPARRVEEDLERKLFALRRRWEAAVRGRDAYACSLSSRTVVYKGLLLPSRIAGFYTDLADPRAETALARWCTSDSAPAPSPRGAARTPTAWSRTTERSTRCAATAPR